MVTEIELKYSLLENNEQAKPEQVKTTISQLLSEQEITFVQQFSSSDFVATTHSSPAC